MQIKLEYPPNIDKIKAKFPLHKGIVFCYGDTLYNPDDAPVDAFIMCHEEVHVSQQKEFESPEVWWDRYLNDPVFRVSQELSAYSAQYKFAKEARDRGKIKTKQLGMILDRLAMTLSSAMYGNLLTLGQAKSKIKNKCK